MTELLLNPDTQLVTVDDPSPSISVQWDRAAQQAVIDSAIGPTIASRAYAIVHTAIFDAWAAYDAIAIATQLGDDLQRPIAENTEANKSEAMSFAAYRVLAELFPEQREIFDELMAELGFDPANASTDASTPAGIGNISAAALLEFRRQDGSNQLGDDPEGTLGVPYSDTTGYEPLNTPDAIVDIERWTAERVPIDAEPGEELRIQTFLTPQWGEIVPFALDSGSELRPPAPEPFLLVEGDVDLAAGEILLDDGSTVEIAPEIVGTIINPGFIEQAEALVETSAGLTDEQKLIAEFWEDAGGTSFPPGTWMTFGQFVSARDEHSLDEDAQLFFALGNAVFDAGITTWEAKVFYDYARPVRAIRDLGRLGLIGEFNEELGGFAIEASQPNAGTQTILATDFLTYQTPGGDPSPPFAEYTSGHSTFSSAAATILELFTGSEEFGASVTFEPGESRFEPGITPQAELTLAWDTFRSAADEAGMSRIFGGIHFEDGDINGRLTGEQVGEEVWQQALFFIGGGSTPVFGSLNNDTFDVAVEAGFDGDRDLIFAGAGNDSIDLSQSSSGNNRVYGGEGNDEFFVGSGDRVFGGEGSDILDATSGEGNHRLDGQQGDDDFFLGRDGRLLGGEGSDRFFVGTGGNNLLTGGEGADQFWIANAELPEAANTISDFRPGVDVLGLGGLADDLSQLDRQGETISLGGQPLAVLLGIDTESLSESDFTFA